MAGAACKGHTELFFESGHEARDAARAICAACSVLDECRAWALRRPDPCWGAVLAGLLPEQRRRLTFDPAIHRTRRTTTARETARKAPPGAPQAAGVHEGYPAAQARQEAG